MKAIIKLILLSNNTIVKVINKDAMTDIIQTVGKKGSCYEGEERDTTPFHFEPNKEMIKYKGQLYEGEVTLIKTDRHE